MKLKQLVILLALTFILSACSQKDEGSLYFGNNFSIKLEKNEKELERNAENVNTYLNTCVPKDIQIPVNKIFQSEETVYIAVALSKNMNDVISTFESNNNFEIIKKTDDTIKDKQFTSLIVKSNNKYFASYLFSNSDESNIFTFTSIFDNLENAEEYFKNRKKLLERINED